jgi:hypothetical protein
VIAGVVIDPGVAESSVTRGAQALKMANFDETGVTYTIQGR